MFACPQEERTALREQLKTVAATASDLQGQLALEGQVCFGAAAVN